MNIFEVFQTLGSNAWLYGGAFVLVLSILVFVHEWGHYIVARMCGVGVETFSIGFGKEIFGFDDKNGTRWKISLIPLGGYVKLFGDVDPASFKHDETIEDLDSGEIRPLTEAEKEKAFFLKPLWKRSLVVAAGPGINYLFAILILTFMFTFNGKPVTPPLAAAVIDGSSAQKHGFEPHDKIISIDGKEIFSFEDIKREMMIALDEKRHFVISRDGQEIDIYAKPERVEITDRFGFKHSIGLLGLISPRHAIDIKTIRAIDGVSYGEEDESKIRTAILDRMGKTYAIEIERGKKVDMLYVHPLAEFNGALANPNDPDHALLFISNQLGEVFVKYTPLIALKAATYESWVITRGTLEALGQMVTGTRPATELGGIIRIGALAGDMAKAGLISLIMFTALLSINLGLINLFPIPLLDGGHLMFYAFEAILRRPIPERIQEYAFRFGLAFLVGIMAFANLNDIVQLIL